MSNHRLAFIAALALCGAITLAARPAAADCTYTVDGHLSVQHQLPELQSFAGPTSPLVGIKVRVESRARILGVWGTWLPFDETVTNGDGFFTRSRTTTCGAHQVRVHVKFQDAKLEIYQEHSTALFEANVLWYQVFQSGTIQDGQDQHLDTLLDPVFRAGNLFDLGADEARAHADIWVLYQLALDQLASLGDGLGFSDTVRVKFPHNGIADDTLEASYANPINRVIYIFPDGAPLSALTPTFLHELMHMWAYQHSRGEGGMAWDLIGLGSLSSLGLIDGDGFDTHGFETDTAVAFHEGFAEFGAIQLMRSLFGDDATHDAFGLDLWLPFNRTAYTEQLDIFEGADLTSFSQLEHFDAGWQSILATLILDNPVRYNFGAPSTAIDRSVDSSHLVSSRITIAQTCPQTALTFAEVLRTFLGASVGSTSDDWRMDDMSWAGFTSRARALGLMSATDTTFYERLMAPLSSSQADALMTCTPLVVPFHP